MHAKKTAFVVEHDFIMATYLADRVIVFGGEPGVDAIANKPESLITGCNTFLKSLDVTFRRDPNSYRPRINKADSQMDQEQKNAGNYVSQLISISRLNTKGMLTSLLVLPGKQLELKGILHDDHNQRNEHQYQHHHRHTSSLSQPMLNEPAIGPSRRRGTSGGGGHGSGEGLADEEATEEDEDDVDICLLRALSTFPGHIEEERT